MPPSYLPIIINSIVFLLSVVVAILVIRFVKIEQKGYKLLFITYTLFWIPLMLCRQYTGVMANAMQSGGFKYYDYQLWLPLAAYGFIGIFTRLFADYFTFLVRYRKVMIYLALAIGIVTFIPIIFVQNLTTNIIQSLGVGVGASMIGTYQLMFNEQYGKSKQFLTVSLLSIPPLIADFISSAIQSTISSIGRSTNMDVKSADVLKYLWVVGLCVFIITLITTFFVKENRQLLYHDSVHKKQIETKIEWFYFVLICLLGSLIAFVKWANSGAIAQLNIEVLANYSNNHPMPGFTDVITQNKYNDAAYYEGYLSLLFSFGQLFGGLIAGLFLINRIGKMWTITIGCSVWAIYEVMGIYIHNPYAYLGIHVLNGFSYGVIYNLILGFILQKTFNTQKASPMGVYQSVMSVGIMCSSFFTSWLKSGPLGESNYDRYFQEAKLINWIIIGAIILAWIIFMYTWLIEKWDYKQLWWHKKKQEQAIA